MRIKIFISILLFLITAYLLSSNLNKPFYGEHDWNGARYGNIARNYLRYGVLNLKFAQIENSGILVQKQFEYFTHYPPLLPILISVSYKIFGISEYSTRLIPLLATSGSIAMIFLIGSRLYDFKTGILASIISMIIPINLYFGKTPVHEPLVVFFTLLSFVSYLHFKTDQKVLFRILFISGLIFAHLTTWAGYFLLPAIIFVAVLKNNKNELKQTIPYLTIPIFIFLLYLSLLYYTSGSFVGGNFLGAFWQRTSLERSVQPENLNFITYLNQIRIWLFSLYSVILIGLFFVWLISLKRFGIRSDWDLAVLGFFGITYFLIFPNAAFIHNYLTFYLMPFLVLTAARGILVLQNLKISRMVSISLPLIFIILIFLERKNFLIALQKSDADKFAVLIGKTIKYNSKTEEVILVSPLKFSYSADKFLRFYSDRNLIYSDDVLSKGNLRVIVDQQKGKFEIIKK